MGEHLRESVSAVSCVLCKDFLLTMTIYVMRVGMSISIIMEVQVSDIYCPTNCGVKELIYVMICLMMEKCLRLIS